MSEVIYSKLAQQIISEVMTDIQSGVHLHDALDHALKTLVIGLSIDRGLIWQTAGDRLSITHEFTQGSDKTELVGAYVPPQESTLIILNFLSSFPQTGTPGVLQLTTAGVEGSGWEPILLLSSGYQSTAFVQLRCDIFVGFISFQCKAQRSWSASDLSTLEKLGTVLSVLLKDFFDIARLNMEATGLGVLVKVLSLFVDQRATLSVCASKSVVLIAEHLGFKQSCLYLYSGDKLVPQGNSGTSLNLSDQQNPFVDTFLSGNPNVVSESTPDPHQQFSKKPGFIVPLRFEEKSLGVFGLWERSDDRAFYVQDRELALWFAGELSQCLVLRTLHSAK